MPDRIEELLKDIHVMFAKCQPYGNSPDLVVVSKSKLFELLEQLNEAIDEVLDQYEATTLSRERARIEQDRQAAQVVAKAKMESDDVHAAASLYTDTMLEDLKQILEATKAHIKQEMLDMLAEIDLQQETLDQNKESVKEGLTELHDSELYLKALDQLRKKAEEKKKFGEQAALLGKDEENVFDQDPKANEAANIKIRVDNIGDGAGVTFSTRRNRNKKKKKGAPAGTDRQTPETDPETGEPIAPNGVFSAEDFDLDREYEEWKAENEGDGGDAKKPEKKGLSAIFGSFFSNRDEE